MSKAVLIYTITIALFTAIPLEEYKFAILWHDVMKRNKLLHHEHIIQDVTLAFVWLGILSL